MLWVKVFHLFFVIAWFACIFYLPRLFVNFAIAEHEAARQQLIQMQRKLLRFSVPWAVLTVLFGVWLISFNPSYYLNAHWLQLKLVLVAILIVYHIECARIAKRMAAGRDTRSHRYYRWFNEFPVLLLLGTLILAVARPF